MKRAGFTMIELIFVIVILGILAAVAIPKLAATRDDANIAKGATQVATAVSDVGAYYTSQGALTKWSDMSNVLMSNISTDLNTTGNTVTFAAPAECISISSIGNGGAGGGADGINIKYTASGATSVCKGIAGAAAATFGKQEGWTPGNTDVNASHTFGGSKVSF